MKPVHLVGTSREDLLSFRTAHRKQPAFSSLKSSRGKSRMIGNRWRQLDLESRKSGFERHAGRFASSTWLSLKKRSMFSMCVRSVHRKQRRLIYTSAGADLPMCSSGEGRKAYET